MGDVIWSARYLSWGRPSLIEGSGFAQCLRFQGQYEDIEIGIFYNRYRYYDPDTSRYLTQDPAGLSGGINLYTYTPNPVTWIDPLGLTKKCDTCCVNGRFSSADDAARAVLNRYNKKSIRDNLEYGGLIYKGKDGKYDFTKATRGTLAGVNPWNAKKIPKNCEEIGYWHTHGNYSTKDGTATTIQNDHFNSNDFSNTDINAANNEGILKKEYRAYVGTPSGAFKGYNSKTGFVYYI